jgi:hypothetical protein
VRLVSVEGGVCAPRVPIRLGYGDLKPAARSWHWDLKMDQQNSTFCDNTYIAIVSCPASHVSNRIELANSVHVPPSEIIVIHQLRNSAETPRGRCNITTAGHGIENVPLAIAKWAFAGIELRV